VKVNSTCRSRTHNAKVGGATHSKHLTGDAADFSIRKNKPALLAYLQRNSAVGGLKLYPGWPTSTRRRPHDHRRSQISPAV
jgi:uncharacterized protein YcbK (DUF882 family)